MAVKFESGNDRICSGVDMSFKVIIIGLQFVLVISGCMDSGIVDISSFQFDPDKEVAAFLSFQAWF